MEFDNIKVCAHINNPYFPNNRTKCEQIYLESLISKNVWISFKKCLGFHLLNQACTVIWDSLEFIYCIDYTIKDLELHLHSLDPLVLFLLHHGQHLLIIILGPAGRVFLKYFVINHSTIL